MFSNMIVLDNGNYNVSWNFNSSSDTVEFLVEVRTTGWIGFGLALIAPNNMMNYDVAVGGVLSNGTGYLKVKINFKILNNVIFKMLIMKNYFHMCRETTI